jgi:DNA polymerase-1
VSAVIDRDRTRHELPNWNHYHPTLGAWMATGDPARDAWTHPEHGYTGGPVACDIETPGLNPFTINCVTFAWTRRDGSIQSVLLDPARNLADWGEAQRMLADAAALVFHNSPYDIPGLVHAKLLDIAGISKVLDTLVYARMAYPDTLVRKSLAALADRLLGMGELAGGMALAFKAAGFKTQDEGYAKMDIDRPTYRFGAMADTVVTLRIGAPLMAAVIDQLTVHPFEVKGITTPEGALALAQREQRVNQIMLARSARGLTVNVDYLDTYRDEVQGEMARAELVLTEAGLRPGVGQDLVTYLDERGELPGDWPRTKTGKLSSAKDNVEALVHPLADAHRTTATQGKILGYLEKVAAQARITGRCHPQVGVLGASATGRMAYSSPELQQFPKEARPIIACNGSGLTSIDWSQIEPVVMANMAGDEEFLAPFEAGADLYEPIQRAAGIDRKTAKVVLLATMYGQGETKLAETIHQSRDAAAQIKRQMLSAMPRTARFMGQIAQIAETYGKTCTVSGRILSIPRIKGELAAYKATNYICQGSAYDVLADTIIRIDQAGLSEHIVLGMHDEIVVDTPAAEAVREIMMTPPQDLIRWSGRQPVFRTDLAGMGGAWSYV